MAQDFIKEVLITHDEIIEYCQQLAAQIETEYAGEKITLLCVLKGSLPFTAELLKHFKDYHVELEFIRASSYEGTSEESKGYVDISAQTFKSVENKHVIILEDILDTGRTLQVIKEYVEKTNPASVKVAALVDKPSRCVIDIEADYVGFVIPDHFVIGFGLDYDEGYRGLKDIVIPNPEKL